MQRHLFITGAASGIGEATATIFAKQGDRITLADIDSQKAKNVADRISLFGAECTTVIGDISKHSDVQEMFAEAREKYGHIEVLVNCAGIYPSNPILDVTNAEWEKVMDLNLKGTFLCSQEAVKDMLKLKRGWIVNMASIDGRTPGPNNSVYSASKAGVISLTRSFAAEFTNMGIRVNAIAPGWVGTENILKNDRWKDAVKKIPIGRMATPEEIANIIAFLCSPSANYIAGEVLNVNGGMLMD